MTTLGGPGGQQKIYKPSPPERGSFPLDHEAECKSFMAPYLRCLKQNRGTNNPECRELAKAYLVCRMENNLMAPDEFRNLGFAEGQMPSSTTARTSTDSQPDNPPRQIRGQSGG